MLIGRFVSNIARCAMTKLSITLPASVAAVFGALAAATDMVVTFFGVHVAAQLQRAHAPCSRLHLHTHCRRSYKLRRLLAQQLISKPACLSKLYQGICLHHLLHFDLQQEIHVAHDEAAHAPGRLEFKVSCGW